MDIFQFFNNSNAESLRNAIKITYVSNLVSTLGIPFGGGPSPAKVTSRTAGVATKNHVMIYPFNSALGLALPA